MTQITYPTDRSARGGTDGGMGRSSAFAISGLKRPLASFRTYRQLSRWNPPPLMIRAIGAHCQFRKSAHLHGYRIECRDLGTCPSQRSDCSGSNPRVDESHQSAMAFIRSAILIVAKLEKVSDTA